MPETNFKSIRVHFISEGKGPVVVLLHGFLEDLTMWDELAPLLSEGHRVIRIDLLGHGKTESLGDVHDMEEQAAMVRGVLAELGADRYTLIGHSMGGYVALAVAELFPEEVLGLGLMNSTSLPDTVEKRHNRDRAIQAVKQNHRSFVRLAIPGLFAPSNRKKFAKQIRAQTELSLSMGPVGIVAALEGMKVRKDRSHLFKSLGVPKLLIIGEQDPALEIESLAPQGEYPGVKTVRFKDGHMSHIENQEELLSSVLQFLDDIDQFPRDEE
jgi:pimeloyl-ACP methyl ester carboxylesterase